MPTTDWQERPRADQSALWPQLQAHYAAQFAGHGTFDLRRAFEQQPQRAADLSFEAPYILADLSKNLIDATAQKLLTQLAQDCGLPAHRDAMLAGERINTSEQRPVTHMLWRFPASAEQWPADLAFDRAAARAAGDSRAHMLACAARVRANAAITDVVNIGIGGSDLGPRTVVQALRATRRTSGPRVHFVANMDGHELAELLPRLRPHSTVFVIASKSFGTAETLRNAQSAREWFSAQGGQDLAAHFIAVSANTAAAQAFGAGQCLSFDEGVGGRFSLWSAIGLPIALAAGPQAFEDLLAGAHAMDLHFARTPLARNLPVQLALLDVWYRNFHHFASRCIAPYHHGLRRLPAYLQQLEMESNGKRVDMQGRPLGLRSAPVIWGEVGSNSQHAFFQMLHLGTDVVPVEFILTRRAAHSLPEHHARLQANALAQARALMMGQVGNPASERRFPGNRPSSVLLLDDLSAQSLGALLALYEHRTFAAGSLWGLNSFDQWGVELGKQHAGDVYQCLQGASASALDPSTAALVAQLRASG